MEKVVETGRRMRDRGGGEKNREILINNTDKWTGKRVLMND